MNTLPRAIPVALCILLGLGLSDAQAKVEIVSSGINLLNVETPVGTELFPAAGRAIGPAMIVGVYPSALGNPQGNARGFSVDNASGTPIPLPSSGLGWLEPNDINASGVFVGQARAQAGTAVRYAFGHSNPSQPLVSGLWDSNQWAGSAATAINNSGVVAGWAQRSGGTEQAFYWKENDTALSFITIEGATSSRVESINDSGLVAGYYDKDGERHGFVFDTGLQTFTDSDLGAVVVPAETSWFYDFRNVSINADGAVAATRAVMSGTETVSQAFVLDGSGNATPIEAATGYRDSFASGISDTGWVIGMLRSADGSPQSGFLWYGGRTFNLSDLDFGANWVSIDAVYDVYSVETSDPLVQVGTIVGMGTYLEAGVPHQRAFAMQVTLQVPEPHVYLMLGIGLLAIGVLRMRRQPH